MLDSSETKEREFEDRIAHRYDRDYHMPPIMRAHSEAFVNYTKKFIKSGDRILDLGCASASLWRLFNEKLGSSVSLVGIDISSKMLERAKLHYPKGDFREGSMLQIPAGEGEFDAVIVSSAFHHISDEKLLKAVKEIKRVLDEHGILIGREPLSKGRLGDRGGWVGGALMNFRHLIYRLTHTREYPEPLPGPDHHAYDPKLFLSIIESVLTVVDLKFRNPITPFVARCENLLVVKIALFLDHLIEHKEGQEIYYAARKNFSDSGDVVRCIENEINSNYVKDIPKMLGYLKEASVVLERVLQNKDIKFDNFIEKRINVSDID